MALIWPKWRFGPARWGMFWIAFSAVMIGGTLGFVVIERPTYSLFDAFYMTVITITTVGFQEVHPLSDQGRAFAIVVILCGVATIGYGLRILGEAIIEAPRRRLHARMRLMKGHVLICGYGRVAHPLVEGLEKQGRTFCVIDRSRAKVQALLESGRIAIEGDATAEDVLATAGLKRATVIAALLPSDGDNLAIAMTAAAMHPGIRVVARAEQERSRANLVRAGAAPFDVVSPHASAGRAILRNISTPRIARVMRAINEIADGEFRAGVVRVTSGDAFAGRTLAELALGETGQGTVMAVLHEGDILRVAPTGSYRVRVGDELVLIGDPGNLRDLGAAMDA